MHRASVILSVLLVLSFVLPARAQTGSIRGTVVDATTQQPLPGVNVVLADTSIGTSTDTNGRFEIAGLTPGTYTVRASFIGYAPQSKAEIRVRSSRPTQVTFELQERSEELDEVVVQASAFADQAEAPTSVQTLGAEEIRRMPGGHSQIAPSVKQK